MGATLERFLDSSVSYVAYGAARALGDPRAAVFKARLYADARINDIIDELNDWPGTVLSSHKSARQCFHKLALLADLGVEFDHPGMNAVMSRVLRHRDGNGVPLLPMKISESYGGSGEAQEAWALCDAPTTLYALITMGCRDEGINRAVDYLAGRRQGRAWGCVVSEALGTWRGPGKKTDPCPYASLLMIKLLIASDPLRYAEPIAAGAEELLRLWENSLTEHPYMFYMGTDFRKLKLPFIWYDALHMAEALSRIPAVLAHPAFMELLGVVLGSERAEGGFVPGSIYQEFRGWDFGQKKAPSEWLGLRVELIRARIAQPHTRV
ncbi:MAG: hypothetical protein A2Y38_22140 [Spirochaetes bacterium GWB1_59_5]|nr:MAG: hypothetical protein A2Y38_22140 [Spirochaetes bacterium GWB1_59_5]